MWWFIGTTVLIILLIPNGRGKIDNSSRGEEDAGY